MKNRSLIILSLITLIASQANGQFENIEVRPVDPAKYINENLKDDQQTFLTPTFSKTLQTSQGIIYHQNTASIVAGNGTKWIELFPPFEGGIKDILLDADENLLVLTDHDVGIFKHESSGRYWYESLLKDPVSSDLSGLQLIDNSLYVGADSMIFELHEGQLKNVVSGFFPRTFLIEWNDVTLGIDAKKGIFDFETGEPILQAGYPLTEISSVYPYGENLIIADKKLGLFLFNRGNNTLSPFNPDITNVISIYPLSNGYLSIGTESAGLIIVSPQGVIRKILTKDDGLPSTRINSIYEDHENGIWIGTDAGLVRIEYLRPLRQLFDLTAYGIVLSICRFQNDLYFGTSEGLFLYDSINTLANKIQGVEGYVFSVLSGKGILVAGSNKGVYQVSRSSEVVKISESYVREMTGVPSDPGMVYTAQRDGVGIYSIEEGRLLFKGLVPGIEEDIRGIGYQKSGDILVAASNSQEIYHIQDPGNGNMTVRFDSLNGVISNVRVFENGNEILYGSIKGLLKYNPDNSRFIFDSTYGAPFAGEYAVYRFIKDNQSNVWLSSNGLVHRIVKTDSDYKLDSTALPGLPESTYRTIFIEDNGKVWFGGDDGLFLFDPAMRKKPYRNFFALISEIRVDYDSLIFDGLSNAAFEKDRVPYAMNDLSFSFSAPSFGVDPVVYSFKLEGFDNKWSKWAPIQNKEYTNLFEGNYVFKVKARVVDIESSMAQLNFTVLPPWYRTFWAYLVYTIIFSGIVSLVYYFQKARLVARQSAQLIAQKAELERERQISEKLRQVDKLKDEFLANTSHELRTPLNGIIGISESLMDTKVPPGPEELRENLSLVVASGKRLASMVDGILDYSKLRTKNLDLKQRPVDLKSLADVIVSLSRPLVKGHPVEIINIVPDTIPQIWADENRVQQILYNLVGNATKFTESGKIEISALQSGNEIIVGVSDTGVGIPEDKTDQIFESFEQLSEAIDRDYIGTGLGLTITKKLVELHGGRIWVDSKVNEGSDFFFTMPISPEQIETVRISTPEWTIDTSSVVGKTKSIINGKFNVLIVDDEPVNQKVLSNILEAEGFQITLASNGEKALLLLDEKIPDLILLDIMMPKMSGYDVCKTIRKKHLMNELPIIFITAKNQIHDLVEGLSYGANDYVTKPFSKDEFLARVNTHLNLQKINDSYSRFVPHEFLRLLKKKSIIDVNLGDQIEKSVTILFSDIRAYTTLSEKLTPKENFNFLNRYLSKVGPPIRNNKGFISHYYGDGIMALFASKPENALKASLEMIEKVREFNRELESENIKNIQIGIGLHSGPSMLGILGDMERMDVNLVSDSVNIASRMEGLTKFYSASIIISESTLEEIDNKNDYLYRFLGKVTVKGKSRTTNVVEIFDADDQKTRELKKKTRKDFEKGIEFYLARNFTQAAASFNRVTEVNPDDSAAKLYIKNSAKYMVEGVPDDWDGVENFQFK